MKDLTPAPTKNRPTPVETPLGWLRGEVDRLFEGLGNPSRSLFDFGASALAPLPALDMTEDDKHYRLSVELPGMKEDDVDVSIADNVLTVSGEKRDESKRKEQGSLISERRYGAFRRALTLPSDVDPAAIKADFAQGVLTITLPKDAKVAQRTRKIPVGKA